MPLPMNAAPGTLAPRDLRPFPSLFAGKRHLQILLGLGLAVAFVSAAVWAVDAAHFTSAAAAFMDQPLLFVALALPYSAAFLLRAMAWQQLLRGLSTVSAFSILHASLLANHLLPIKAGEVLRPYLATRAGSGMAEAAATTLLARLMDFACLLLIAAVCFMLAPGDVLTGWRMAVPPLVVLGGACGVLWLRAGASLRLLPLPMQRFTLPISRALADLRPGRITGAAVLTLPAWVLEGAVLYVAAMAMGIQLSLPVIIGATAFTILFQTVHVTPGGLGVYEAAMTAALTAAGVPVQAALGVALLTHGLKFAYSYSLGLLFSFPSIVGVKTGRHLHHSNTTLAGGSST